RRIRERVDVHDKPVFLDREMQPEGTRATRDRRKAVFVKQIGDRRGAFLLDLGAAGEDAVLVERQLGDALRGVSHRHLAAPKATKHAHQAPRLAPDGSLPALWPQGLFRRSRRWWSAS